MSTRKRPIEAGAEENEDKSQKLSAALRFPYNFTYEPKTDNERDRVTCIFDRLGKINDLYGDLEGTKISTQFQFGPVDRKVLRITRTTADLTLPRFDSLVLKFGATNEREYSFAEISSLVSYLSPEWRENLLDHFYSRLGIRLIRLEEIAMLAPQLFVEYGKLGRPIDASLLDVFRDTVRVDLTMSCTDAALWCLWSAKEKRMPGWINMAKQVLLQFQYIRSILK